MTISVIIPLRDCEAFIGESLASILDQSRPPDEVIVVDDGSSDRGAGQAAAFGPPVCVVRQAPTGTAAARNHGVRVARGDLLAFLDADDLAPQDRLARQSAALEADPKLDAVVGIVEEFVSDGPARTQAIDRRAPRPPRIARLPSALTIRAASFRRVGAFDERAGLGEGLDWFARADEAGLRIAALSHVVARRRLHDANIGLRERGHQIDYVRALRAALARRRATRADS